MKKYFKTSVAYFKFVNKHDCKIKKVYLTKKYIVVCL